MKTGGGGYQINAANEKAEILIYDDIGDYYLDGLSAKAFINDLKAMPKAKEINVRINSEGGSVFDGITIHNALKNYKANVNVMIDGLAASIASVIAMAGDTIEMAENAFMMIHDPWLVTAGSADDLRKVAEEMDMIRESLLDTYVRRTGGDKKKISDMMHDETWMNAEMAAELGFADTITEERQMAAKIDAKRFRHVPEALIMQEPPATPRKDGMKNELARIDTSLRKLKI